ncbi:MAG TPA: RagB/SusD family nutrient uptake outer membrane protein [Balneolaceae bacterium]
MNLKNSLLVISVASFFAISCNVLSQEPKSAVSSDHVIYNERTSQIALNGLYSQLQNGNYYGGNLLVLGDVSSDISQSVGTWDFYRAMDTYTTNVGNLEVEDFWEQAYATINQANNIIAKVPPLDNVSQETKDQILGEAYFIRALAYFDLNRAFGGVEGVYGSMGVPLVLQPTNTITENSFPSRPSINKTYAQVESDLKQAIELLSGSSTPTRASEAAAKALLSRLFLYYQQDYGLVEKYATEVITAYDYQLLEDYASIFISEETAGSIFELSFTASDQSDIRFWYFPPSLGGRADIALHQSFVNLLQSRVNDERAKLIAFDDGVGVYYPTKYQKVSGKDNVIILRLAEMYLNRAEARTRKESPDLNGALSDLNIIRNRAGLADTTGAGVDTAREILDAIALERSIEFFEEGHRWFNLVRTERAMTVLNGIDRKNSGPVSLNEAGRQVWPIPQREIDANKNIEQNEAYN